MDLNKTESISANGDYAHPIVSGESNPYDRVWPKKKVSDSHRIHAKETSTVKQTALLYLGLFTIVFLIIFDCRLYMRLEAAKKSAVDGCMKMLQEINVENADINKTAIEEMARNILLELDPTVKKVFDRMDRKRVLAERSFLEKTLDFILLRTPKEDNYNNLAEVVEQNDVAVASPSFLDMILDFVLWRTHNKNIETQNNDGIQEKDNDN